MKKIKFEKKLSLSKETIAKLNNEQLNAFKGGGGSTECPSDYVTCKNCYTYYGCQASLTTCTLSDSPAC
ncbi:MAG TPA: class I lanthipeptide [Bacteroidia bacterium]|jgi:hypothetical protein|nr:class I lanthipeptide [Bacteroidia bacterium]